jgi:RNA polymerase sigma factor (sigma-70 family)
MSYGLLYDRYAEQVYNYCLRLTGSADDAADATQEAFTGVLRRLQDDDRPVLEFSAYLFAAARNESYALMRARARVRPSDTPPEERWRVADVDTEPERAAMLHDSQEAVRTANARLAPRHREVLALRELSGHSYDDIGRIMGISENGAAQLIWRARSKLREAMTAGAVASVVATSEDCERAQVLLTQIQDGEPVLEAERIWLDDHLDHCGACRAARGMLLEVGASYRCWMPVGLFVGLKVDTLTAAGSLVGADWSGVAGAQAQAGGAGAGAGGGGAGGGGSGGAGAGGSGAGVGGSGVGAGGSGIGVGAGGAVTAVGGVATLAAVGVGLAAMLGGGSGLEQRAADAVRNPAVTEPAKEPNSTRDPPARSKAAASGGAPTFVSQGVLGRVSLPAASPLPPPAGQPEPNQPADPPKPKTPDTDPTQPEADALIPTPPTPSEPTNEAPADTTPPSGPTLPNNPPPGDPTPPPDDKPPPDDSVPKDPPPKPDEPANCNWPGRGEGPSNCPPGHEDDREDDDDGTRRDERQG